MAFWKFAGICIYSTLYFTHLIPMLYKSTRINTRFSRSHKNTNSPNTTQRTCQRTPPHTIPPTLAPEPPRTIQATAYKHRTSKQMLPVPNEQHRKRRDGKSDCEIEPERDVYEGVGVQLRYVHAEDACYEREWDVDRR